MGYPNGKILLASTETYENEQPVVLSVFQVCLQNALHTHFYCSILKSSTKTTNIYTVCSSHSSQSTYMTFLSTHCDRIYTESFSTLFSLIDHHTLPPFTLQDSIRSLKWDPTGHLLLCLGRSEVVKILGRFGGTWVTLHSLIHPSNVNIAEWCPLAGRAPDPRLMMAV